MSRVKLDNGTLSFFCPACRDRHAVDVKAHFFDGNMEYPTIRRAVRIKRGFFVCHSIIRNGRIYYLDDSTHDRWGDEAKLKNE